MDRYSPAAALAAARKYPFATRICVSTLYSYIDKRVFYELGNKHLWEKWKKKPKKKDDEERRVAHPKLPSIEIRPENIARREEYGHWEMDLVVSGQGGKSVLLTLTERMSRQEIIIKLPDRKAETIRQAIELPELVSASLIPGADSYSSSPAPAARLPTSPCQSSSPLEKSGGSCGCGSLRCPSPRRSSCDSSRCQNGFLYSGSSLARGVPV